MSSQQSGPDASYGGGQRFSPESIREQLTKILSSSLFADSERMRRFLLFAVEHCLGNDKNPLKEYVIGVEVFDRDASYDPRIDPIVRVEARRLRAKLNAYYEGEGRHDGLIVEFPKGGYSPRFRDRAAETAAGEPAPRDKTIAVLPFTNLSPDPDSDYFSDGLTEELIHALTKAPGMRVVAWPSAARLRDRDQDLTVVREQLNVATILRGSVRLAGSLLRVTAQLIDASSGIYLWSESYDRRMEDLFAIQQEIALAIVAALKIKLIPADRMRPRAGGATNLEAYNLYLKGRFHWNQRTTESLQRGIALFSEAILLDGEFALAYAGLADSYTLIVNYGLASASESLPKAKQAAEKALKLDPSLSEAYTSLAMIRSFYDWDWEEAGRLYRKAVELNPGYATAHHWYGIDYLALMGRFEEAKAEIEIAIQLDPLSAIMLEERAFLALLARRYDESIGHYRRLIEFDPSFYRAYTGLGRAYSLAGMYDEAIAMLCKGRALGGDVPNILSALGHVYALAGRRRDAHRMIEELKQLGKRRSVPFACYAIMHLGLGETERALDWLEASAGKREMSLASMGVHPLYDPIRSEPRFQKILAKIGLGRSLESAKHLTVSKPN